MSDIGNLVGELRLSGNRLMQRAADALEAQTGVRVDMSSAVGVEAQLDAARQPTEDDRDALKRIAEVASEQRLMESIGEWRKALGADIDSFPDDWELEFWHAGYKHGALAMIEHQLSRAAVPDAATEREIAIIEDHREKWMARAFRAETERDAALAAVERVRVVADDWARDEDAKGLHFDLLAALDGAPEPEWEYQWGEPGESFEGFDSIASEELARAEMELDSEYPSHRVMRRRKAGPWEVVEGESRGD